MSKGKKLLPEFHSDAQAEQFVETADLSEYDLSQGMRVQYEFQPKTAQVNLRIPEEQLRAVKEVAALKGIPYTRLVRQWIEQGIRKG